MPMVRTICKNRADKKFELAKNKYNNFLKENKNIFKCAKNIIRNFKYKIKYVKHYYF